MIQVNQKELMNRLKQLSPIVKNKTNFSILKSVKIEAKKDDQKIVLSATNLEQSMIITQNATVNDDITFIVDYEKFSIAINNMIGNVELIVEKDLKISCNGNKLKLNIETNDINEYPEIITANADNFIGTITDDAIVQTIKNHNTILKQCKNGSHFTLETALLENVNGETALVTIDGRRLLKNQIKFDGKDFSFKIPKMAMSIIENVLKAKKISKKIDINIITQSKVNNNNDDNNEQNNIISLVFTDDCNTKIELVSCEARGKYPNYKLYTVKNHNSFLQLDKKEFQTAIKSLGKFADSETNKIVLYFTDSVCELVAKNDTENVVRYSLELAKKMTTCDISFGFNYKLVSELIDMVDSEIISFFTHDGYDLKNIMQQIEINCGDNNNMVFMPMRVENQ